MITPATVALYSHSNAPTERVALVKARAAAQAALAQTTALTATSGTQNITQNTEKNEEIAASRPRDGRLTVRVPASERDSRKRAPGGFCGSGGRTTPLYPIVSPGALMQQEVSPRPLVEPYDDGSSTKGVRPTSPLVLRPPCTRGTRPDSGPAPEVASW